MDSVAVISNCRVVFVTARGVRADVGAPGCDARRSDESKVRHEQQQSTDDAAAPSISSYEHRPQEPG